MFWPSGIARKEILPSRDFLLLRKIDAISFLPSHNSECYLYYISLELWHKPAWGQCSDSWRVPLALYKHMWAGAKSPTDCRALRVLARPHRFWDWLIPEHNGTGKITGKTQHTYVKGNHMYKYLFRLIKLQYITIVTTGVSPETIHNNAQDQLILTQVKTTVRSQITSEVSKSRTAPSHHQFKAEWAKRMTGSAARFLQLPNHKHS